MVAEPTAVRRICVAGPLFRNFGAPWVEMGILLSSLWAVPRNYLQCCQSSFSQAVEELLTANTVASTGRYPSSRSAA